MERTAEKRWWTIADCLLWIAYRGRAAFEAELELLFDDLDPWRPFWRDLLNKLSNGRVSATAFRVGSSEIIPISSSEWASVDALRDADQGHVCRNGDVVLKGVLIDSRKAKAVWKAREATTPWQKLQHTPFLDLNQTIAWIQSRDPNFVLNIGRMVEKVHSFFDDRLPAPRVLEIMTEAISPLIQDGTLTPISFREEYFDDGSQRRLFSRRFVQPYEARCWTPSVVNGGIEITRTTGFQDNNPFPVSRVVYRTILFLTERVLSIWPACSATDIAESDLPHIEYRPIRSAGAAIKPRGKRGAHYPWEKIKAAAFKRMMHEGSPPAPDCDLGWRHQSDLERYIITECRNLTGRECCTSSARKKAREWSQEFTNR